LVYSDSSVNFNQKEFFGIRIAASIGSTEKRTVKDLIPLDYNPRIRTEKKQAKLSISIEKFNLVETPVINLDNRIIAGQRRWEVFMESGRGNERIDVRVPSRLLTEEEVKEYNLHICMDWKHVHELTAAAKVYTEAKQLIVWKKDSGGMGTFYRSQHELIFVYKNGRKKHINNFMLGESGRYRTNVWEYAGMNSFASKDRENLADHPTVKPVKLVADAILDCSNPYDVILDAFPGSGTTLLAAEQTNRICYGMELDARYCDLTVRRWLRFMKLHDLSVTVRRNGQLLSGVELEAFIK
jgi:hypothetical protein